MWSLSPKRRTLALWLILFLAIAASSIPRYEQVGQRMDDGALLLYPELILKGWLPYRDFETFYGPLMTKYDARAVGGLNVLLLGLCDIELIVPAQTSHRIQEGHKVLYHALCEWVDQRTT